MSNRLLKEVRRLENLRGPARAILMVLADHADEKGICWPSIATIARETGFASSTVKHHLRNLRDDHGVIDWQQRADAKGDKTSNLYRVKIAGGRPGDDPPRPGDGHGVGREAAKGRPGAGYKAPMKPQTRSTKEAGESPYGVRKGYVEELED